MLSLKACAKVFAFGLGELERTPSKQSREDPVVLENPVELALVNSRSMNLEGTSSQQSGEDSVVLENPVELASLDRILHGDTSEAEFYHVFHECRESSDFESCLGELDVEEGLVELAVDMDMCAAVARSKHSNTDIAGAASDAMWWLVDSGASTHLINEETLQGVRVVSQTEHAGVDCVTATGASVGIRKSAVVQVEFRLGDPEGQTVLVELEVVRFNLLSLGRLLDRSWDVQFVPEFRVKAAKFSFLTRWKQNCGWLLSVPSVSSSASSVLGSQAAPCGDGSKEGNKQPVLSVDRGGDRKRECDSEQYRAGVGLRGRALRGHHNYEPAAGEDPVAEDSGQGAPEGTPQCSKGESQLEQLAKSQGDAKEESCAETSKVSSDAVASEVLRRGAGDQREACSAEALQGQDPCQALCQAGRARDVQCPGEGHGSQVCSLRATKALALGSFRMSSPSLRGRSRGAETCQLQSCGGLGRGMQRGQLHHHYPRGEDDGHHCVEDGRVWDERGSALRERQSLSLHHSGAPKGFSKEEVANSAKTPSWRSTDDPTTCTEDINHSEDARNSQQGPVGSSGSSGDGVACFVAVPRHGLKRQGARPATSPHNTATTSTTIDSPTSSSPHGAEFAELVA